MSWPKGNGSKMLWKWIISNRSERESLGKQHAHIPRKLTLKQNNDVNKGASFVTLTQYGRCNWKNTLNLYQQIRQKKFSILIMCKIWRIWRKTKFQSQLGLVDFSLNVSSTAVFWIDTLISLIKFSTKAFSFRIGCCFHSVKTRRKNQCSYALFTPTLYACNNKTLISLVVLGVNRSQPIALRIHKRSMWVSPITKQ